MDIGIERTERPLDPQPASPPVPAKRNVRVSTWRDVDPTVFTVVLVTACFAGCVFYFFRHPAFVANSAHAIISPFKSSQTTVAKPVQPEVVPLDLPAPRPKTPDQSKNLAGIAPSADQVLTTKRLEQTQQQLRDLQKLRDEDARKQLVTALALTKSAEERAQVEAEARAHADQAAESERIARQKLEEADAEREKRRTAESEAVQLAASGSPRTPLSVVQPIRSIAYTGPRSGTIHWEGEVHGTELITIDNGRASSGRVTGNLPGVPVLIQPVNGKKVGIASPPAPGNDYRSMVFRVTAKGTQQLDFQWALP